MKPNLFLTAEWKKLVMANYEADENVLKKYLPFKTELDHWEGKAYVSLVGFMFQDTRVRGFKIPFHVNFPEVNLRFYVKYKESGVWKRGVVFVSEMVPKAAISFVANKLFKEKYSSLPMRFKWRTEGNEQFVGYYWRKNKEWNSLTVNAQLGPMELPPYSKEEFITEHFWGYSKINGQKTCEYHVEHPRWNLFYVNNYQIECDFENIYGKEFSFLNHQQPASVFLAEGSNVKVFDRIFI